uniref:Uncharacterized protein n=1 Tax=Anguilla anguilla TaxID=7936 RepID=A0A0E9VUA8_ANGAN
MINYREALLTFNVLFRESHFPS